MVIDGRKAEGVPRSHCPGSGQLTPPSFPPAIPRISVHVLTSDQRGAHMRDRFADLLTAHLRRAGLPIRRVACTARIPRQTLSNWLRGTRPRWHPTLPDDLRRLGLALGLDEPEMEQLLQRAGCLPATAMARDTCEAATHPAASSPPPGWFLGGTHPDNFDAGVEPDAVDGKSAAYLRARVAMRGMGTVQQQVPADAYRGQRLRLSALVRSDDVDRWSGLWMRIEGMAGSLRRVVALDNMRDRPVVGTTEWTRHAVVLDVPEDAVRIVFGFLLAGGGQVWAADMRLEAASPEDTPTGVEFPRGHPGNPAFAWPGA